MKFQKMLAYAIQNDDLDTMRACYMIEAYEDLDEPKDKKSNKIVDGKGEDLEGYGAGKMTVKEEAPVKSVGQSDIVLKPKPLDHYGDGEGKDMSHLDKNQTGEPTIVTEPNSSASSAEPS